MARKVTMALLAVCFVLASGWVWYAAAQIRTPAQQAQQAQPPAPSVVTAEVEDGPLVEGLEMEGVVGRSSLLTITGGEAGDGVLRQVITAVPVKAGHRIRNGQVIAEVSGRPVFALTGAFPAYRDLTAGMTGPDVRQLQRALRVKYGTPLTGKLDSRTQSDVERLYRANGYEVTEPVQDTPEPSTSTSAPATSAPVTDFRLPAGELAFVPSLPATVGSVPAKVGGNGAGPLVTVATGEWRLKVPLSGETERQVEDAQDTADYGLAGLDDVEVRFLKLEGKSGEGQRSALFALDGVSGLKLGATVSLRMESRRSPDEAVVVPASALWTKLDGTVCVTVVAADGTTTEVPVTVATTSQGRVAVTTTAGGRLRTGDKVVVAERDAKTTGG